MTIESDHQATSNNDVTIKSNEIHFLKRKTQEEPVDPSPASVSRSNDAVCKVKPEYRLPLVKKIPSTNEPSTEQSNAESPGVPADTPRSSTEQASKKQKRQRGQNKKKERFAHYKNDSGINLCPHVAVGGLEACKFSDGSCRFSHDVAGYLKMREDEETNESAEPSVIHTCPNYETFGECRYGLKCRFYMSHTEISSESTSPGEIKATQLKKDITRTRNDTILNLQAAEIPRKLRKKEFDLKKSEEFNKYWESQKGKKDSELDDLPSSDPSADHAAKLDDMDDKSGVDLAKLRPSEKKRIDFRGKTYLAPLTTVGNLPFRRICKEFGVDITCGEMAMGPNLIKGISQEWTLFRRHKSEDIFGVQLAGSNPTMMATLADVISQALGPEGVDFIDLNMGCPVEGITSLGCGSGLMERRHRLRGILSGWSSVLGSNDIPITVKLRTGIKQGIATAHKLLPLFEASNVQLLTLHGRSKEQRYTKLADWAYINEFASQTTIPVFGNGDILSPQEYHERVRVDSGEKGVAGAMIGRGALIKPWIFKEIQSGQLYDISSAERLEVLKNFAAYGLEYWGSDSQGINNTRRFLCEWLSFAHRYVPVGLLEVLPQKINERPERFKGRNELETLMASGSVNDWVKLTELVLGKVKEGEFHFIPKHKSSAYEAEVQG